ncbi:hypothetical protein BGZ59_001451 [Podila verticillata]|nr:hypothetical protein BGZ59_001451 [Podila verticillata]
MAPSFKVLIAGAGIGGATLAVLLERANVDYMLFESSPTIPQQGSAIILSPNIMPLMGQLGLIRKLEAISKRIRAMNLSEDSMKRIGEIDLSDHLERTGYHSLVMARSDLLEVLLSQVPKERIHFNKRITSFQQNKDEVTIRCEDDTQFQGQILVGADGADSGVRINLYRLLTKKGILNRVDAEELVRDHVSFVGVTKPLSEDKYSILGEENSHCHTIVSDQTPPFSWSYYTIPGNRICWSLDTQLDDISIREQQLLNEKQQDDQQQGHLWESESLKENPILEKACDFALPIGGTLGDLIKVSENISKAESDERLFETWNHGRTVLMGDACHMMLPNAGQGAVVAMQDAVTLANLIHELPSATSENLVEMFKDYQAERYPSVKAQMSLNQKVGKIMTGQTWTEALIRKVMVRCMSKVFHHFNDSRILSDQPQASFLPLVGSKGKIAALPQRRHRRKSSSSSGEKSPKH